MTKASDNAFPSILITEGTEPSAPAAGKQRLYIDSTTHKLKRTDSGGVDVDIESTGSGAETWLVDIIPMFSEPSSNTGPWAISSFNTPDATDAWFVKTGASIYVVGLLSSGAQNDEVTWKVWLTAGTWNASFYVRKSTNTGIITLNVDAASQGTADTYAASAAFGKVTVNGWTVAASGAKSVQVKMASKNGSSGGYYGELFAISLRRTA